MPVHSMVKLPKKLNKKELLKRHITITRNQGEIKLFVDGFEALGSIKNSGVSNVSFENIFLLCSFRGQCTDIISLFCKRKSSL